MRRHKGQFIMYNTEDGRARAAGSCWRSPGDCENFQNAPSGISAYPLVFLLTTDCCCVCVFFFSSNRNVPPGRVLNCPIRCTRRGFCQIPMRIVWSPSKVRTQPGPLLPRRDALTTTFSRHQSAETRAGGGLHLGCCVASVGGLAITCICEIS